MGNELGLIEREGELAPQRFDIVRNGGHRFGNITATDLLL